MKMNDSGNIYGLSTTTDTHMIKNMELGAVAYLSHSKYGTCTNGTCHQTGINNNSNYITGCGAVAESSESATCNSYNTKLGMLASTTGNIYGVYDMSGGAIDYAMGNMVSLDGATMMSGTSSSSNSGYTGIIYNSGNYSLYQGTYSYPDTKYYDKYSFGLYSDHPIRSKLGDSIKETYNSSIYGWYDAVSYLPSPKGNWFFRGGHFSNASTSPIFSSITSGIAGGASLAYSSYLIITP